MPTVGSLSRILLKSMGLMIVVLGGYFVYLDRFFPVLTFLAPVGMVFVIQGGIMIWIELGNPFGVLTFPKRVPFKKYILGIIGTVVAYFGIFAETIEERYGEPFFRVFPRLLPSVTAGIVLLITGFPLSQLAREDISDDEKTSIRLLMGGIIVTIVVVLYAFSHVWGELL